MRIVFVNHSRRKIGGVETYLDAIIPAVAAEHDVSFLYEGDSLGRDPIAFPQDAPTWDAAQLGRSQTLHRLEQWKPDVCFVHGLEDSELEASIVALGNGVLYVHNYYGTCISGNKMIVNGVARPCERQFGPACLARYFPDRCGGSNPLTMLHLYRTQSHRLKLMKRYRHLIANSDHMRREIARHGLASECVFPFVRAARCSDGCPSPASFAGVGSSTVAPLHLMFSGRMTFLKGGDLLVEAASLAQKALQRKLHVTFCGDGPQRRDWQQRASQLQSDSLSFDFPGWLTSSQLTHAFAGSHLHVMPSLWPEPFGLSGLEAGTFGVPSVAFAVGGIPEWLHDGVNGHLASPPSTAESLANGIVRALSDEAHYNQLRNGATEAPRHYNIETHVAQLLRIFNGCAR
jgi:glycosyltransferase involved in cell wall biosynthesis